MGCAVGANGGVDAGERESGTPIWRFVIVVVVGVRLKFDGQIGSIQIFGLTKIREDQDTGTAMGGV